MKYVAKNIYNNTVRAVLLLSLIIMFWGSYSYFSYASVNAFGPAILRKLHIVVQDMNGNGDNINISININELGNMENICINNSCNDIVVMFPILKNIKKIVSSDIKILSGIYGRSSGRIRIILPFLDYNSVGCSVREEFEDKNYIILTFDREGVLHALAISCDLDVPFKYERTYH